MPFKKNIKNITSALLVVMLFFYCTTVSSQGNNNETNVKITEVSSSSEEEEIALIVKSNNCNFKVIINNEIVLDKSEGNINSAVSYKWDVEKYLINGQNKIQFDIGDSQVENSSFSAKIMKINYGDESTWETYTEFELDAVESYIIHTGYMEMTNLKESSQEEEKKIPMLYINGRNFEVQMSINNIPVINRKVCDSDSSTSISLSAYKYLTNGKNTATIKIAPCNTDEASTIEIDLASGTGFLDESWDKHVTQSETDLSGEKTFTKEFEYTKEVQFTWESAPKITLDKKTIKKLDAFLKKVYKAINSKNGEEVAALMKYYRKDTADLLLLYGQEDYTKFHDESLIDYINSKKLPLIPLKKGNYKLIANGKLVDCVGEDNLPLIRSEKPEEGYMWRMDMKLGLVDGEFYILLDSD